MPAMAVTEALTHDHTRTARYAWKITADHLHDAGLTDDTEVGISGPATAPDDLLAALDEGHGREFHMLDDDDELYYTGRIIVRDQPDTAWTGDDLDDFGPLHDFGTPNAGCTSIQYGRDGQWVTL